MRHYRVVLGLLLVLFSCSDGNESKPDLGLDFFPLQVGSYIIYDVDETQISQSIETKNSYEIKTIVTDRINEAGIDTYIINRQKKATGSSVWESFETWSVKIIDNKLVQNESNVLFVKLIFPLSDGLKWNGNLYNNLPDYGNLYNDSKSENYFVSEFNKSFLLSNGSEIKNTATITHNNFMDDIIGVDQRLEVYSRNIGLIYKEVRQLEYCTSTSCLGQQKVVQGTIYKQSMKEHGVL